MTEMEAFNKLKEFKKSNFWETGVMKLTSDENNKTDYFPRYIVDNKNLKFILNETESRNIWIR